MSVLLSSSAEDVIARETLNAESFTETPKLLIREVYLLDRCAEWILRNNFQRVALQFPDTLLPDAATIYQLLTQLTERTFFILGDTTYGSCCVDEIAAEHGSCDSIIHFGTSCLSPSSRLPVALVFPSSSDLDLVDCCQKIRKLSEKTENIILLYDTQYFSVLEKISSELPEISFSKIVVPDNQVIIASDFALNNFTLAECPDKPASPSDASNFRCGRRSIPLSEANRDIEDCNFVYIGPQTSCMVNLFLQLPSSKFYSYDPKTQALILQTPQINRRIMRRYYLIEKAKDAKIVGILVGTLGVKDYLGIIERLKQVIKAGGKRFYTFVMGKPNPAKLANFMEVDVFVYVACPESFFDSKDFFKPVITPHEMEIACEQRPIDEGFVMDFRELLPGGAAHVEVKEITELSPDVSLLSGLARVRHVEEKHQSGDSHDLVLRDHVLTVSTAIPSAGDFLASRSWKGLDPRDGTDKVEDIVEGRHGIAESYTQEHAPPSKESSDVETVKRLCDSALSCCENRDGNRCCSK